MQSFEQRLALAMEVRGLTQTLLAQRANTTQSTVYRWLSGTKPRARILDNLCNALHVRKLWLLRGEGEMDETSSESFPDSPSLREESDDQDPILSLLRNLDFASLCGVADASLTKLRQAGQDLPLERKHLRQAVEEMERRAASNKIKYSQKAS